MTEQTPKDDKPPEPVRRDYAKLRLVQDQVTGEWLRLWPEEARQVDPSTYWYRP